MKFPQLRNRPKQIVALSVVLLVAAVLGWYEASRLKSDGRIYRIGFDSNPPQHFVGPDGRAAGLAVDVIEEAARRRGIRIQWILEPESSEAALKAKKVDLWPMMTIRPERKGVVYITDPYRENTSCLVVRNRSAFMRMEDLQKSRIAYDGEPIELRLLRLSLPNAQLSVIESSKQRLEAVCGQRVEAAQFDEYTAVMTLLDGISCGGEGLRLIQTPEMSGLLGVGATFEARPAADAIREEIRRMAADGTLDKIGSRWGSFSTRNLGVASELARAQTRERWLVVGICGAVLLLLLTLWQAATTRRALATAREATLLKSRFVANMSHEIRTPMNAILGMTALAMESSDQGEQMGYLKDVMQASESLLCLLNDILDFSKIEAGRLTFERVDFDPAEVLRGVCSLLASGARGKGLDLAVRVREALPGKVQGDPARLRQALVNLLGNAVKFTEKGRVDLEAAVEEESNDVVRIRFSVRDTGIGISKEAQRRIFESFVQADGSMTRRYGGTGLGLSISRELISKMGGELHVESEPGRGSAFWFILPFEKVQEVNGTTNGNSASNEFGHLESSTVPQR